MPILRISRLPLGQHPRIRPKVKRSMIRIMRRHRLPAHQRNKNILLSIDGLLDIPARNTHKSRHRRNNSAPFRVRRVPDGRGGDEIDCRSCDGGAEAQGLGRVGGVVAVEESVADGEVWREGGGFGGGRGEGGG